MAIGGYSANTTGAEDMGVSLIPAGVYEFMFAKKELRNKDGVVSLNLTLQATDGSGIKGRKLFEDIVLHDPAPDSKRPGWGRRVLKTIGKAVGYPEGEWTDAMVDALIGKRVMVDVRIEGERPNPRGGTYSARNRVETYMPVGAMPAPAANNLNNPAMAYASPPNQQQYAPSAPTLQPLPGGFAMQPAPAAPAPQGYPQQQQQLPQGATVQMPPANAYAAQPPQPAMAAPPAGQPGWMTGATQ